MESQIILKAKSPLQKEIMRQSPRKRRVDIPHHQCVICLKQFQCTSNLNKHIRTVHKCQTLNPDRKNIRCSLCNYEALSTNSINDHLESHHEIILAKENYSFISEEEFQQWKELIEKESHCEFVKHSGSKKRGSKTVTYYYCHRSGTFESRSKSKKRNLKVQGTNKINGYCPAVIRLFKENGSGLKVEFTNTHVGHTHELSRVRLSEEEKIVVAYKLSQGYQIDDILNDTKQSSDDVDRLTLLKRRDVLNIEREFNLRKNHGKHDPTLEQTKSKLKAMLKIISKRVESCKDTGDSGRLMQLLLPVIPNYDSHSKNSQEQSTSSVNWDSQVLNAALQQENSKVSENVVVDTTAADQVEQITYLLLLATNDSEEISFVDEVS